MKQWNMQTVKKNPSYVCDDTNAKHTNVQWEPGPQDHCDDTIAERANISTKQDMFVTTQMQLKQIIEQKKKSEHIVRLWQHKCNLYKQLNRTHCTFGTTQMQNLQTFKQNTR